MEYVQVFVDTYITSYEGITSLILILILLLKLYINREAKPIDYKKMIVSIPGEIMFLVLGFQISKLISNNENDTNNRYIAKIIISLILLIFQYALEKWTDDKLSGDIKFKVKIKIILMYIASIYLYINEIYGGL